KKQYLAKKIKLQEYLGKLYNLAIFYKRRADKDVTGAFSRTFLEDIIKIEHAQVSRNPNQFMCLMLIDIDYFKKYNDTFGHRAGDDLLNNLVALLKKHSRKSDIICRYGGEEFAVILTNTNDEIALKISKRWRKLIKDNLKITISAGICQDMEKYSIEDLIKNADSALYQAKESGRNREVIFK
ncbi:MAG TPA: GGDEF domain-containing protein, partial [Patescibacteria group bacterium]|nr:GGDEF domain-containing protein [Patescibacteria group bacterium]